MPEVCLSVMVRDIFTQNGNLCQRYRSVSVAPNTFVRVCVSGHTHSYGCLSGRGPLNCTRCSVPVFSFSEDPNHVSAPFSLSFIPPSPTISSLFLSTCSLYQVDPGPREGRPPGLVALSRAPQPPPFASRHEPSLPKNQAGVETAQRRGGQKEVRLGPRLSHPPPVAPRPALCLATTLPGGAHQLCHQRELFSQIFLFSREWLQTHMLGPSPVSGFLEKHIARGMTSSSGEP